MLITGHSTGGELQFLLKDRLKDKLRGLSLGWGTGGPAKLRREWVAQAAADYNKRPAVGVRRSVAEVRAEEPAHALVDLGGVIDRHVGEEARQEQETELGPTGRPPRPRPEEVRSKRNARQEQEHRGEPVREAALTRHVEDPAYVQGVGDAMNLEHMVEQEQCDHRRGRPGHLRRC